jgi:hypothetical protein
MEPRNGQRFDEPSAAARCRYVALAAERLKRVSERLGCDSGYLLRCIRERGWTWEQVTAPGGD